MNEKEIRKYNKISSTESIKIVPFDIQKRYTSPHKHDKYLEIVYFIKGSGAHYLDFEKFEITPHSIFFIKKEEVHHWEITTEPVGYVILIKESFLAHSLDDTIAKQLLQLTSSQCIQADENDFSLFALFSALTWEMNQKNVLQQVIEGGLKAILAKMVSYADASQAETTDKSVLFLNLLSEKLVNSVSYYAGLLHTSAQNLNVVSQKAFGKTASDVIAVHMIKEIKRQLIYTNKSINAIAYDLSFKDTSHFTKYFKRYVSLTPLQYRKKAVLEV
ncbi:helix-turn-helix domain-containing protein [Cellulophaga baltica]|uniref:helix-turn-helix domain-containing protein n=1 Tax=Cellulophaga baltica TaxID=76594 RepID=UPI0015F6153A|nr:helix-turn-helix domain-containing protein [Cellulophaga baltica]MBA6315662.1 helix-turn-helix domain-containing protein [Cellulophaga baltica]